MPATEAPSSSYTYLEATLTNASGHVPLYDRFRALFTLKNLADDRSVDIIAKGPSNSTSSLRR